MANNNSLKGTSWIVTYESNGSQGILTLNSNTTGSYKSGPSQHNITWAETWVGNYCALWVVFNKPISENIINIWGLQLTMQGGTGMSAFGNAMPQDLSNTTFVNDNLTIMPKAPSA